MNGWTGGRMEGREPSRKCAPGEPSERVRLFVLLQQVSLTRLLAAATLQWRDNELA